jgi:ribonuclease BN (tRNA processing enzyme)
VWVSHTHADHFSDLAATFYALRYADISRPPLTVFGPPGWADRLRAFLSHTSTPSPLEDAFDVREVDGATCATVGGLELTAVAVHHDAPCYGVRVRDGERVVAYTGDTGPCAGLATLAAGADLLISEAGYGLDGHESDPVHLTAAQAGAAAGDGGVGTLLLTHLAGADVEACVAAATSAGGGRVIGAAPGVVVRV